MIVVGVDYSMTCPAACFMNPEWGTDFSHAGCVFLTNVKKHQKVWDVGAATLVGKPLPIDYTNDTERFTTIAAQLVMPFVIQSEKEPVKFYLEGYSMGSKGKIFNIAEHTGMLKYLLWLNKIPFEIVPPTKLKKFATGMGNADKSMMYFGFVGNPRNPAIDHLMFPDRGPGPIKSPVADIVDSYFLAKYGVECEQAAAKRL